MSANEEQQQHWADRVVDELVAESRDSMVISTGISPSGEIHIGHLREVLTADAVFRSLGERGFEPAFNYVADNFDPLRKVYPFLDPARYAPLVGRPLSEIPCPCDGHASYAEHYLEPFLAALSTLRVGARIERADQMYKSGRMTPFIIRALERRDRIVEILHEATGRQHPASWSPFNPLCGSCGRIDQASVSGFSAEQETVRFSCACGTSGEVPMAGGGKLVWRVDWPARWAMFGVTIEPFGKDHSTRGGSFDTGKTIVNEIFEAREPFPIPYEWIRLKGRGDMSSSKGNVLSIDRILEVAPPEALRYLVMRDRPQKTIAFDPGLPLLQLVDQVDDAAARGRNERAIELSRAGGFQPVGVPYKHLVVVAQIACFDRQRVLEILSRGGYPDAVPEAVAGRMEYARRWLDEFAPEDLRFTVEAELPASVQDLDPGQRQFLGRLGERIEAGMDGDAIQALIYELAAESGETENVSLFRAIYEALLGKPRGPRVGWFVALLGAEWCARRFREAAGG